MKPFKRALLVLLVVAGLLAIVVPLLALLVNRGPRPEAVSSEPVAHRPAWVSEGIVAAGYTEGLSYLVRRGGDSVDVAKDWTPDPSDQGIRKLKQDGVNVVVISLHKGFGLKAEVEEIEAARKYVEAAHRAGLKVIGYVGASIMYETFFSEEPEARDWIQVDEWGRPIYYTGEQTFRYMACRNNPGYQAFVQKVLRVGIEDVKLDGIHFDQMRWSAEPYSCRCKYCRAEFQKFLRERYRSEQLKPRFGFSHLDDVIPPPYSREFPPARYAPLRDPLMQDWAAFRAVSLARRLGEYDNYIHKLNPQVALRYNPTPMEPAFNSGYSRGIDPQYLLQHGDLVTSEERNSAEWTNDGRLVSKIRSFKAARIMGKRLWFWQAFPIYSRALYSGPPVLRMAEAIAYNDMCLGAVAGRDVPADSLTTETRPYVDFFWKHAKELRQTTSLADVAVLRAFSSVEFNPGRSNLSTVLFEQTLIQSKIPFDLIYDRHLKDLSKYKVLVLANQDALSDEQVGAIRRFVENGGGLVATEESSLLTDSRRVRTRFGLAELLGVDQPLAANQENKPMQRTFGKGRVVYIPRIEPATAPPPAEMNCDIDNRYWVLPKNHPDLATSVRWAAGGELSVTVDAPLWVTLELARQPSTDTLLLHLINFKVNEPLKQVAAKVRVPDGYVVREAVVETPDSRGAQALKIDAQGAFASFRLPSLKVYDLVLLRLEKK